MMHELDFKTPKEKTLHGKILLLKAASGSDDARYLLAWHYLDQSDFEKGIKWLKKCVDNAYAPAQNVMGMLYEQGKGITKDEIEAAAWYTKAAHQGFAEGATNLGKLYYRGSGVEQDYKDALRWLEIGAKKGASDGSNSLAWLLSTCPDSSIRNGKRAINLLAHVVNFGRRDPIVLDTLGAAYAEEGIMESAIQLVSEALAHIDQSLEPDLYHKIEEHQKRYLSGLPWRESDKEHSFAGFAQQEAMETGALDRYDRFLPVTGHDDIPEAFAHEPVIEKEQGLKFLDCPFSIEDDEGEPDFDSDLSVAVLPEKDTKTMSVDQPTRHRDSVQMDRIVEKLVLIEELLRPLKLEEEQDDHQQVQEELESSRPHKGIISTHLVDKTDQNEVTPSEGDSRSVGQGARAFSQTFVDALLSFRYSDAYSMMEGVFQKAVPENRMEPMVHQMYEAHGGEPAWAELRADERVIGGEQKPVFRFWYDLSGKDMQKGNFSLFTEIVTVDKGFACSAFFVSPIEKSTPHESDETSHLWYP